MAFQRVPIAVSMQATQLPMHLVATLCGKSWTGMTHSDDLVIQVRRALEHAMSCADCIAMSKPPTR